MNVYLNLNLITKKHTGGPDGTNLDKLSKPELKSLSYTPRNWLEYDIFTIIEYR